MTCEKISQLLPLLNDAELSAAERAQVQEHLSLCRKCAEEASLITASMQKLHVLRHVAVPSHGPEHVLQAVRADTKGSQLRKFISRILGRPLAPAATLLAAAALLIVLLSVPDMHRQPLGTFVDTEDRARTVETFEVPFQAETFSASVHDFSGPALRTEAKLTAADASEIIPWLHSVLEARGLVATAQMSEDGSLTLLVTAPDEELTPLLEVLAERKWHVTERSPVDGDPGTVQLVLRQVEPAPDM